MKKSKGLLMLTIIKALLRKLGVPQRATPQQLGVPAPLGETARPGEARAPAVGGVPRSSEVTAHRRRPGRGGLRQ